MKLEFIEVGEIVNTHGVRGELKLNPWDVDPEMLRLCKKEQLKVVVGSDAHFYTGVGTFDHAQELMEKVAFPPHLVWNTDVDGFLAARKRCKQFR